MGDISNSDSDKLRSIDTQQLDLAKDAKKEPDQFVLSDSFGRYRVIRSLGRGGFGQVFLAKDPALDRSVAIKVPKFFQQLRPDVRSRFMEEGRSLAKLSHPAVVAVFDVGVSQQGQPYVVMEFVAGQSLSQRMKARRLSLSESLDLLIQVADGLRAMHQSQVVHRDLKPGNIVIDSDGRARIIDFGLALNDGIPLRQLGRSQEGTPSYMAPEQVRGLNHHLDGRTDIWSFGVTMYQLMTGRLPFGGRRAADLGYRICSVDPLPLRQLNSAVPVELERICLRCVAKSMSERYESASDLLQDLNAAREQLTHLILDNRPIGGSPQAHSDAGLQPRSDQRTPQTPLHGSTVTNVVTHGLRAFGQRDADYFFELLPGQRDAQGVPETIGFWQQRLGASASDQSMTVGVIYGPSGCGKTSFVRAGLLPRLVGDFDVVYLECDPRQTEARLNRHLDQKFPALSSIESLEEKFRKIRLDSEVLESKRMLLVLDQFEQWLRPLRQLHREPLVESLRQLDGNKISCLILVRDDYWMGITQFMRSLDLQIQEGVNAMAYPLFDRRHAEKVLTTFGQSMNCLPKDSGALSKSQRDFISAAVKSFARNGKVICVHLALFAQMMRDRTWESTELKRMGGWKGVGVRYLEEMFSDPEAPRAIRGFLPEVSAILERLLPCGNRDMKGSMVAETELKQVSNMVGRADEFEQVLEILLNSTRLISQVDRANDSQISDERYYQLSHDFLVGPIHDWLEKQRLGSWRGRAHLRLAELSKAWTTDNDARFLPTTGEWARVMLGVPQRIRGHHSNFLATATKRLAARWSMVAVFVVAITLIGIGLSAQGQRRTGQARAQALFAVRSVDLKSAVEAIGRSYRWTGPWLDALLEHDHPPNEWRVYFARLKNHDRVSESFDLLIKSIDRIPDEEIPLVISALQQGGDEAIANLERSFASESDPRLRARIATILLFMGQADAAQQVLAVSPDMTARTLFINRFGDSAGELNSIVRFIRDPDDFDFESGLCLAVGRIPPTQMTNLQHSAWIEQFRNVFRNSPSGGSHSAAQWALITWGQELPSIAPQSDPPKDKDWWVMEPVPGFPLTFVRIPAGEIVSGASAGDSIFAQFHEKKGTIPEPVSSFWISATEVPLGLFEVFDDSLTPDEQRNLIHESSSKAQKIPSGYLPITGIKWLGAIKFCNWLSKQTNRAEAYDENEPFQINPIASGFRLPMRLEWEYACLAHATTLFFFGDMGHINLLADYSWYISPNIDFDSPVNECGRKMPNPWGLFDVLGNATEWSSDGKPGNPDSRYELGGHNTSPLEALYAGFPNFGLSVTNYGQQGIRICLPDR